MATIVNKRLAAAQQTRANLIETGLVLAEELGLEGLSVNAVVSAAGVSKGTFFHHFSDRVTYLVRCTGDFTTRCSTR